MTTFWLLGLFACLAGVELYIDRLQNGIAILVPEDRVLIMRPIVLFYGGYLTGILAFWYKPPFSRAGSTALRQIRFWLAFAGTFALNSIMVYLVWRNHFGATTTVHEDVANAVKICGLLSFVVAPANVYYFGTKMKGK